MGWYPIRYQGRVSNEIPGVVSDQIPGSVLKLSELFKKIESNNPSSNNPYKKPLGKNENFISEGAKKRKQEAHRQRVIDQVKQERKKISVGE